MSDIIRIEGLTVDCVVGIYPNEREAAQPLTIDLDMHLDTRAAALNERVRATVDYAATASQLVFLLRSCRFRLIETAAHALAAFVLAPPSPGERRASVGRLRLRLTKPGALRGFAVPSLTIEREASEFTYGVEDKTWGSVDVIHETRRAGIYRLNIEPGAGIPLHVHRQMREAEMVLTDGVEVQGRRALPGTVHRWPRGAAHRYDNPTDSWQTVLCVDSPPFIEQDEIPTEGESADVPPEPPWGPVAGAHA